MSPQLVIVDPAMDLLLAPIEALRVAAGLAADDNSRDQELEALGLRISAEVIDACGVAVGKGAEPTLRKERVAEAFEACADDVLVLARRHNIEIITVTEDDVPIVLDARSVDPEAGLLERWVDGRKGCWRSRNTVVTYDAGFDPVPPGLAGAVTDIARIRLSEASADPLVKALEVDVDGIDRVRTERWVGGLGGQSVGGIPADIMARLERFVNRAMR